MADNLAVVILTFNAADVIERTLTAARKVSPHVICVDSGSTDGTLEILTRFQCELHQRAFLHYADQRNWAIRVIGDRFAWQLHLDADEIIDDESVAAIAAAIRNPNGCTGFLLKRRTYFLGRPLRFAGTGKWHLRLFESGACEDRMYDQHFICEGAVGRLSGWIHDMNVGTLTEWIARHNRWSDLEARELRRPELDSPAGVLQARLGADPRQRRRSYKGWYYRSPPFLRAWVYFLVRYFLMLGFLDGRAGFLYAFFQALWFRMLVDTKLTEAASLPRATMQASQAKSLPEIEGAATRG
jgi:glycosyltransferase involved in cell wall biosynthesis